MLIGKCDKMRMIMNTVIGKRKETDKVCIKEIIYTLSTY